MSKPDTIKVRVKILDKQKKSGWLFGPSYSIVVRIFDTHISPNVLEIKCNAENYYDLEVGKEVMMTLFRGLDGLYYPHP
jgi:hypothetical protein